jgi:hypothetical protein
MCNKNVVEERSRRALTVLTLLLPRVMHAHHADLHIHARAPTPESVSCNSRQWHRFGLNQRHIPTLTSTAFWLVSKRDHTRIFLPFPLGGVRERRFATATARSSLIDGGCATASASAIAGAGCLVGAFRGLSHLKIQILISTHHHHLPTGDGALAAVFGSDRLAPDSGATPRCRAANGAAAV